MLLAWFYFLEAMALFPISRFVQQGCPLAPFLFILFGEALSAFLRSSMAAIQAITLPIGNSTVLAAEFGDDTGLYILGDVVNIDRVWNSLQIFSDATGASLYWIISVGLWASDKPASRVVSKP